MRTRTIEPEPIPLDLKVVLVGSDEGWTVDHADQVRRGLMRELAQPGRLLWINVELHTDPAWDAPVAS